MEPRGAPGGGGPSGGAAESGGEIAGANKRNHGRQSHLIGKKFHQRVRKDVERGGDVDAVRENAGWCATRAGEPKNRLAARVSEPAGCVSVDSGVAARSEEMRVVAGAEFADGRFEIAGETFAEPRRRARARENYVGDFMEVGGGAGDYAVDGEMDGATASEGNRGSGAKFDVEAGAAGEAGEPFEFAETAGGECGECSGIPA